MEPPAGRDSTNAQLGDRNAQTETELATFRNAPGQIEKETAFRNKEQVVWKKTIGRQTQSIL